MKEVIKQDGTFEFFIEAELRKGEDGKKWISGIASTSDEDLQGEKIKQDGLDLSYFLKRGFFNDDHAKETGAKVGIPTEAKVTKSGLWVKGFLLETKRATEIYDLAHALSKSGNERKLGFSVEGKVLKRNDNNPRIIEKAWIKDIAITASPINPNTFLDIAKSLAADCTEVFVYGDSEEDVVKAGAPAAAIPQGAAPEQQPDPEQKEEEEKAEKAKREEKEREEKLATVGEELEAFEDATKKPTSQTEVEKKDAEEAAKEALDDKHPKQDIEKMIPDVPVAKRAGKSIAKKSVDAEIEVTEDGTIIVKGFDIKIKPEQNGTVEIEEGEEDVEAMKRVAKEHKKAQEHAGGPHPEVKVKKSEDDVDLTKAHSGWKKMHEVGGEKKFGDKKIPTHATTYEHPSGNKVLVVGRDGCIGINLFHHDKKNGKHEILGHWEHFDNPKTGEKATESADRVLQGLGIKHEHCTKEKHLGKALIASNTDEKCDLCNGLIKAGDAFMVKEGKTICDEACLEKALVAGYSFGVTDQEGGSALRVESLEGSQRDMSYGQHLNIKAKEVSFDSSRANGGKTYVTLKDAVEFLMSRGLPEDVADRVLVLLIKNNGDISSLANKAKSTGGK